MATTGVMAFVCLMMPLFNVDAMTCLNGIESEGSRQRYWNFNTSGGRPILADLVSTNGKLHAVFNTREGICQDCPKGNWEDLRWWFKFDEGTEEAFPISNDPHRHTLVISCKLRLSDFASRHVNLPIRVTITTVARFSNVTNIFNNLTFCRYPNDREHETQFKYHLGACTSVARPHLFRAPEWLAYHIQQGWEHFYVYANEDPSAAKHLLAPLVDVGLVDIIDYEWPQSSHHFLHQISAENSCLIRYRGLARWVSMIDVDEFFLPLMPITVAAFLHQKSDSHDVGSFRFLSYLFGSGQHNTSAVHPNSTGPAALISSSLCISKFPFRGAQPDHTHVKAIVQPMYATYFSVHDVTLGAPARECYGEQDIKIAHYKTPHILSHPVLDTSLCQHASAVSLDMTRLGFKNFSVPESAWSASWIPRP